MLKRWVLLIFVVLLLAASVVFMNLHPTEPVGMTYFELLMEDSGAELDFFADDGGDENILELTFSHTEHFYTDDIEVSISASVPDAVIYYTTDGSEPTTDSEIYSEPLSLQSRNHKLRMTVIPLKAIAVNGDEITRPLVHTYFISDNINERFDVLVVSLSTDSHHLYDNETGILVPGVTRSEYVKENPGVWINPPAPANFNWRGRESERPVYVEMFNPDGERIIAQAAGMRVHGGWSRAERQKSLRLIARKEYEPSDGKFKYDFFPEDVTADGFYLPITEYDELILSNNANDRNFGMLRQEVNYALARKAGLRVTASARAAAVFLNGEYYGFTWVNTGMNAQYLEDLYSAPARMFQIVENSEKWVDTEDPDEIEAIEYFNSFYTKDFSDPAVLSEFESVVDLDNLLLYYAYQTFAGNRDWPNNNMKRWRYVGPPHNELPGDSETDMPSYAHLPPELDGRWRYITYDLDFLMGLYEGNANPNNPSFRDYVSARSERFSYMLFALFSNPDIVNRYAMYICDIAANIVTPDNVAEQIERLYAEAYSEIGVAFNHGKYDGWVSYNTVEDNHKNMIYYTERRADHFMKGMREYFGWDDQMFTVEVSGSPAIIGTQLAESSRYFGHLSVPVRPYLSDNTVFDRWVLNGETIESPELLVSSADAVDGVVSVELYTRIVLPDLQIIDAFEATTDNGARRNGAALLNTTEVNISTTGLFLTDDLYFPQKWAIPEATITPGNTLQLAGRSSRDFSDLFKVRMDFNVRSGRLLYLCNDSGEVLDWVVVE